ncbi:MAG TPA: ATP-dependent DNA helicase RecG, partial [Sphingobacteriaceae bacterium]|nr:ATP-dependent DNA helicase RecG [Sphingobacteriaceae bacterium]
MENQILITPIEYLKGVGLQRADVLRKELGISTYNDLLQYYPFRYIDRTKFYKIRELNGDLPSIQLIGRIVSVEIAGAKHTKRLVAEVKDETGVMELVWFQAIRWIEKIIKPGAVFIIFGKPTIFNNKVSISHPEMELYNSKAKKTGNLTLQPVYGSTEKLKLFSLDSKGIQHLQETLMGIVLPAITETLPGYLITSHNLNSRPESLLNIHFPSDNSSLKAALFRLKFEELFFIQLKLLRNKLLRTQKFKGIVFEKVGEFFNKFYSEKLPFELTNAQKRVLKEIRQDTQRSVQMNRLLQGDVGSGKTVVALMSMLLAIDNGYQACIMAPTEILAQQHYKSIVQLLGDGPVNVALLTGSVKKKDRKILHEQLETGELHILIGTHALIEDAVKFHNLGLVIIDEP